MKLLPSLLLSAALPLLAFADGDTASQTITLTRPGQPATLRFANTHGTVTIVGADRPDILIESTAQPEKKEGQRPDGLRVISTSAGFSVAEKDNVVEVNYGSHGGGFEQADFKITVPKTTTVDVSNNWGGDVSVDSLSGDVAIKNMTGEITLQHLSGGALVETMNGEIKATFDAVPEGKPLSFTSMNGEIELKLPADTKANVRFRTQNGSILTDFPEDSLKTKTEESGPVYGRHVAEAARIAGDAAREAARVGQEVAEEVRKAMRDSGNAAPRPPRPPRPPSIPSMVGGKVVSGTLNGGGTDVQVATMNGDIIVRKLGK